MNGFLQDSGVRRLLAALDAKKKTCIILIRMHKNIYMLTILPRNRFDLFRYFFSLIFSEPEISSTHFRVSFRGKLQNIRSYKRDETDKTGRMLGGGGYSSSLTIDTHGCLLPPFSDSLPR